VKLRCNSIIADPTLSPRSPKGLPPENRFFSQTASLRSPRSSKFKFVGYEMKQNSAM
jgi:hypothetical protein